MNAWFKDIDRATTEAEIVAGARDYCSLIHPRDLEPLPEQCRAIRIDNDADIPRVRERLAQGYSQVRSTPSEVEKLRDLLSYFAKASERLNEIRRPL
ncbi:MAG: hypothetical protein ACXWG1_18935 [Usitatibacter sp.]